MDGITAALLEKNMVEIKQLENGKFAIFQPSEHLYFEDEWGRMRKWETEASAVSYLRYSRAPWKVLRTSGKYTFVNCVDPAKEGMFGPHDWRKMNLVTRSDRSGIYDVVRCQHCGKTVKCYGLNRPAPGVCHKNKIEAGVAHE